MYKVVTEADTYSYVRKLVSEAKRFVVIISPYVNLEYIKELVSLKPLSVFMQIYCLNPDKHTYLKEYQRIELESYLSEISLYKNCKKLRIYTIDDKLLDGGVQLYYNIFHCKCYFNEYEFCVSSMNLSSFFDRPELGISFSRLDDSSEYDRLMQWYCGDFCYKILGESQSEEFLMLPGTFGACNNCGKLIKFDRRHPYCSECVKLKKNYGMKNYCHYCGNEFSYATVLSIHQRCYRNLCDTGSI